MWAILKSEYVKKKKKKKVSFYTKIDMNFCTSWMLLDHYQTLSSPPWQH